MKPVCSSVRKVGRWLGVVALVVVAGYCPEARAALGEDPPVATGDRPEANVKVMRHPTYTVHERATPTGATVREFVGQAGKVFAVSWSGGWRPNLRDLLGTHYDRFIAATRGRRATRGIARIELPGMTVVMGGYLRTFFGRAVLTDLLPAGLSAEDLR